MYSDSYCHSCKSVSEIRFGEQPSGSKDAGCNVFSHPAVAGGRDSYFHDRMKKLGLNKKEKKKEVKKDTLKPKKKGLINFKSKEKK